MKDHARTVARRGRFLDRTLQITLILKGLDGVLEMVGGILLFVVTPQQIGSFVRVLTQHELSTHPSDPIANWLVHGASGLTMSASHFAGWYLLLHGLVKIVLVWAVLKDYLWAYPWMIAFLLCFIAFQCYRIVVAFSWGMVLLTLFDILMVWLTWREYAQHRARLAQAEPSSATRTRL